MFVFSVKECKKPFGCLKYPAGCSLKRGTCLAYALTELVGFQNKTDLKFELNWLSEKNTKSPYVGLILSKSQNLDEPNEDIMIVCHQKGVSIIDS